MRIENRPGIYASFVVIAAGIGASILPSALPVSLNTDGFSLYRSILTDSPSAYFIYKLQRIYGATSGRYSTATATLTIFSVVCIVLLVATFVMMGLCMRNFGKGLKERSASSHLS